MTVDDLKDIIPNNINVIGNSQSIFNNKYSKLIDSLPTIRFNRIEIVDENSQGSRWDFLASSEIKTFEMYNEVEPKFHTLLFTPAKSNHIIHSKHIRFKTNLIEINVDIQLDLRKRLGSYPSTGLQILNVLEKLNCKVNIFGFDWKETPTIYDPDRTEDPHNYNNEKSFALSIIKNNNWKIY